MLRVRLDPTPRSYAPSVSLLRRSAGGPHTAPDSTTVDEIEEWLLAGALREDDQLTLFESLVWRLVATGLPLDRASLHVGTLHPQLFGFAWNWNRTDALCDEIKVTEAALQSEAYKRNPLFRVIEYGEGFQATPQDRATAERFPLMAELARQGISEYLAVPLHAGASYHNAATLRQCRSIVPENNPRAARYQDFTRFRDASRRAAILTSSP